MSIDRRPPPVFVRALACVVFGASMVATAQARTPPTLWSCDAPIGSASGASLGKRSLVVGVSPEGACWLDWGHLDGAACKALRRDRELVIDLPGRGQAAGTRWVIEVGATDARASDCKVGDRVRDADPSSYVSRGCLCKRATLAEAGLAWRKANGLDAAAALLMPHVEALVREPPAQVGEEDLAAAHELAVVLDQRGAPADLEASRRYATFAATRGHAEAAFLVGKGLEAGRGVAADPVAAVTWYRKAAEGGIRRAMMALGMAYEGGAGVDVDLGEALRWYRAATEAGSASGMLRLGRLYRYGKGTKQDPALAYQWLFGASLTEDRETRGVATRERDEVGQALTPEARAAAEANFRAWNKARRQGKTVPPR